MRKIGIISVLLLSRVFMIAQIFSCSNMDFESGDFSNWQGYTGYNGRSDTNLAVTANSFQSLGINSPTGSCSFHTLVTPALGTDPYGGFAVVPPDGGNYVLRLGGNQVNTHNGYDSSASANCTGTTTLVCSNGEVASRWIAVAGQNYIFTYNYAIVLQDGSHPDNEQAYFRVDVLDGSGGPIYCFCDTFSISGGSAPPGFTRSVQDTTVFYSSWKTRSICLMSYIGQTVTVRFTAAGCTHGDHFAYAYLDASCSGGFTYPAPTTYVCGGTSTTLSAPDGFQTYHWTGSGIVGADSLVSVTVNAPGTYTATVDAGMPCYCPLIMAVGSTPTITIGYENTNTICTGDSVGLIANGASTYTWSANAGSSINDTVFVHPLANTNYTVIGTDTSGCVDTATTTIYVMGCSTGVIQNKSHIQIHPNPTRDKINIEAKNINEIKIFDLLGKEKLRAQEEEIDISDLPNGIYFISVRTSAGTIAQKIVVQH